MRFPPMSDQEGKTLSGLVNISASNITASNLTVTSETVGNLSVSSVQITSQLSFPPAPPLRVLATDALSNVIGFPYAIPPTPLTIAERGLLGQLSSTTIVLTASNLATTTLTAPTSASNLTLTLPPTSGNPSDYLRLTAPGTTAWSESPTLLSYFNSLPQSIPSGTPTPILFDTILTQSTTAGPTGFNYFPLTGLFKNITASTLKVQVSLTVTFNASPANQERAQQVVLSSSPTIVFCYDRRPTSNTLANVPLSATSIILVPSLATLSAVFTASSACTTIAGSSTQIQLTVFS